MRSTYRRLISEDLATHLTTINVDITAAAYHQHMLRVCREHVTHTPVLTVLIVTPTTGASAYTQHRLYIW